MISELQTELNRCFYSCAVDDKDGPQTRGALKNFLFEHNYTDDPNTITPEAALAYLKKAPAWARFIDVSKHNGDEIDFMKVKRSGVSAVYIKAGGGDKGIYKDKCFDRNSRAAVFSQLKQGAYFFHEWEADPEAQADSFYRIVGGKRVGDLYPCLDVEDRTTEADPAEAAHRLRQCLLRLRELFGVPVLVYTSASALASVGINTKDNGLDAHCLWVPRYKIKSQNYIGVVAGSVPACYPDKRGWFAWQQGAASGIPGVGGLVDRNFVQGGPERYRQITLL